MREIWAETSRAESTYARICLPRWKNTRGGGGGITRRRNRIYVWVGIDWPPLFLVRASVPPPPPPPPPPIRGWSRRFPREQSFGPAYLLQRVFHFSFARPQFVHVSAGTRVQFTPFSETRPNTRTCRVSPGMGPGRGREIHSSFPWNTPTRVALTTRNGEKEEMGAIKRWVESLGWFYRVLFRLVSHIFQQENERCDKSHDWGHDIRTRFQETWVYIDTQARYIG